MEKPIAQIYESLQRLIGFHRQLLEAVRAERGALVEANIAGLENVVRIKQELIEAIYGEESSRLKLMGTLAALWKKPLPDLSLNQVIIEIQGADPKGAAQLRSAFNALTILIQRIVEQNRDNRGFVEQSLEHIHQMKTNILSEVTPKSNTYTQQGQRANRPQMSRLISKEV